MQNTIDTTEITKIWEKTLSVLQGKLPKATFETCLIYSKIENYENNNLTINVPGKFAKDWLEREYKKEIKTALTSVSGKELNINFTFSSTNSLPKKMPQKTENTFENNQSTTQVRKISQHGLNPKYTFSSFVVGNSNSLAHAGCLAVAENPAMVYNPLFIYGGVGLGKTHLLNAVGHHAITIRPELNAVYVSTETFTNDLINAIKAGGNGMINFRNRYRTVDILLIDDIQFLINKERTQEEFFYTFNDLHTANKQIVISSDRPPKEIPTLEDRLRSRFEWGLIADIKPPDMETRQAILRKKAEMEHINISNDIIEYIAEVTPSNIRELAGALVRIVASASLKKQRITLDFAKESIDDLRAKARKEEITVSDIQQKTVEYFGITLEDINSKKRDQKLAQARQIAMYLSRELTKTSFPEIGRFFGGKDHTTVMHACEKILDGLKENDPDVTAHITNIKNLLK
jgi:chromosomal replication initiator protein